MFRSGLHKAVLILTVLGFIPFLVMTAIILFWHSRPDLVHFTALSLLVYAAMISGFLGAIHWGVEITKRDKPRLTVLAPSIFGVLTGWGLIMAVFQSGIKAPIFIAMAGIYGLHYLYDQFSTDLPLWYRSYRIWPTVGVILCLALVAWACTRL